ncbi:MAG: FISUMP domain-containing protein [Bacteroidales bacterium]|nr:FISUMP domain-containing protein [Bacteroidales bacterium]
MKKTVLLLFMSIALFGCKQDAIDDQLSNEEVTIINELVSTVIDDMITESSNGTTPPDSLVLFNQIEALDGVTSAQFNPSGTILSVQLKDGTSSHILVVTGDNELWFDNSESDADNAVNSVLTKANEQNYIVPMGDKKALILAPFAFQATGINDIDYNSIYNKLSVAGFQVDSFMNKNASIQRFRGDFLSQYDIIIINTHGGVLADNGTVLVTGTLLEESYSILSNAELAKCKRIVMKKVPYVAITPSWLEYTTTNKFNNSWVFILGCETTKSNDLYSTFLSLGAEAFNGFNFTVSFFYGNKFLNNMVSQFTSGKTFLEASEYTANNTPIGKYGSYANLWFAIFGRNQTEDSKKRFDAFQKHEDIPFFLVLPSGYQRTPSVIIKDVHSITNNSASISCEVTFEGAARVTTRGICWSTSENPDMSNSTTTDGMGLGTYTSNITGLSPNTTYYVRPYATNTEGTKIGVQSTFTTTAQQATPTVTTGNVTNISTTTASCAGNVTSDGGAAIIASGVCWSTSQNPTIENSKTTDGADLGPYTSHITDLSPNTTYYVRAYATNANGTTYGTEQRTFKTLTASDIEYGSFTDSRDGNVYKTVAIGDQVWMAENLAYLPSVVGPATGSEDKGHGTDPCYYVYGYDGTDVNAAKGTENYTIYGVLYNVNAAMAGASSTNSNPSGVQGICPDGWHLPSNAEWTQLEEYLIANGYNYDGTTTGDKIAISMASATGWAASTNEGAIGNDNTAYDAYRNKSGFTALPGGCRSTSGTFTNVGIYGYWRHTREQGYVTSPPRGLGYSTSFFAYMNSWSTDGLSVRCVRD